MRFLSLKVVSEKQITQNLRVKYAWETKIAQVSKTESRCPQKMISNVSNIRNVWRNVNI